MPLAIIMIVLGLILALTLTVPTHAEGPPEEQEPMPQPPVFLDPEDFDIPPIPPIPTKDEYVTPQRPNRASEDDVAQYECGYSSTLVLAYYTQSIPDDHGGGTAEGYSGFYYGTLASCHSFLQPVSASRVTYGGEVEYCRMKVNAKRHPNDDDDFWRTRSSRSPCNLTGARKLGPMQVWVYLVPNTWTIWGDHFFEDGEGADYWYAVGDTFEQLRY